MSWDERIQVGVFFLLWFVAIGLGIGVLESYVSKAGSSGEQRLEWPESTRLERNIHGYTIVLAVHPHCPCTRATAGELSRLLSHLGGRAWIYVLALCPREKEPSWAKTSLVQSFEELPGVRVFMDRDGREIGFFGQQVSGDLRLYDREGILKFSGGITPGRGHEGGNFGWNAVISQVVREESIGSQGPVFGCPLFKGSSEEAISLKN